MYEMYNSVYNWTQNWSVLDLLYHCCKFKTKTLHYIIGVDNPLAKKCLEKTNFKILKKQLTVVGRSGVHGDHVVYHVVEEVLDNVCANVTIHFPNMVE